MVPGDLAAFSPGNPLPEIGFQCRLRRTVRPSRASRQCYSAVLHERRGSRGPSRLFRKTAPRLHAISKKALKMNRIQVWAYASRPKTLVIGISPVLIGSTLAIAQG